MFTVEVKDTRFRQWQDWILENIFNLLVVEDPNLRAASGQSEVVARTTGTPSLNTGYTTRYT